MTEMFLMSKAMNSANRIVFVVFASARIICAFVNGFIVKGTPFSVFPKKNFQKNTELFINQLGLKAAFTLESMYDRQTQSQELCFNN